MLHISSTRDINRQNNRETIHNTSRCIEMRKAEKPAVVERGDVEGDRCDWRAGEKEVGEARNKGRGHENGNG